VIVVYTAEVIGGMLEAADESVEARMFPPDDVPWPDLAFDSTKDALNEYIKSHLKG
jgi:hypothetical protein